MIIAMVTPHLPPDQAANALLPQLLADGLVRRGHEVRLMSFEPKAATARRADVRYIARTRNGLARKLRLAQIETAREVWSRARGFLDGADVVHVHSNTLMNQVAAAFAYRNRVPYLLTHYGTEIWHYRKRPLDPFLWMNRHASHVTYYSRLLLERSLELGVEPPRRLVVYPPVSHHFRMPTPPEKDAARRELGLSAGPVLLNVKRLHPLGGQRYLVEAMPAILEQFPAARPFFAGEGESRGELEGLIAELGIGHAVTLLGLVDNHALPRYYQAADLFVLPSKLEAFPTVAAEALASGLRIVSGDHPGGVELEALFPGDVALVPRERVGPLAKAIVTALEDGRPASEATRARIDDEFRPEGAVSRYLELYREAKEEGALAHR